MTILPPKYAAVRVRLPQADKDAVLSRAKRDQVPLSVIVRRALRAYLKAPVAGAQPAISPRYLSSSNGEAGA